jgi:membrane protein
MPVILHIFKRLSGIWNRISRADIGLIAAGVAFFGFLAIFPALAAVIAIWGYASDPVLVSEQLVRLQDFLPAEAYKLVADQVNALLATQDHKLGLASIISTLLAIWSARAGVSALIGGLNAIHGLPARTGLWHLLQALILTFVLVGLALAVLLLAVIVPLILNLLPLGPAETSALALANFGLSLLLVGFSLALAYRLGPNRDSKATSPKLATKGLLLAIVLWAAVSRGLVFYLANFNSYNEVYGSIGAVVALLMWFYLSTYAVLLGAAVDAELERPTT